MLIRDQDNNICMFFRVGYISCSIDHHSSVYKVDNLYLETLSSFLVLLNIRVCLSSEYKT